MLAESIDGHGLVHKFCITEENSVKDNEYAYTITKDEKSYARLAVRWRNSAAPPHIANSNEMEHAWLFEKLTGLGRDLYPRREDFKNLPSLEDYASVRVTGNKEATQKLSVHRRR